MSRGLGETQRRLLVALYCADEYPGRWGELTDFWRPEDKTEGWVAVSQLHLVEIDDTDRLGHTGKQVTTPEERALKRSRRVPYRRALHTLTQRGLAEARLALVELADLGQYDWYARRNTGREAKRAVWLARLTERGRQWVTENASDYAASLGPTMVVAANLHDPEKREDILRAHRYQRRVSEHEQRRRPAPAFYTWADAVVTRAEALSSVDVVDLLTRDGFDRARVTVVLRGWYREQQQQLLREVGDRGPALEEYSFGSTEVEELRQRLS